MEAKYQVPWNDAANEADSEDEGKDALCENNFVQAAACVARSCTEITATFWQVLADLAGFSCFLPLKSTNLCIFKFFLRIGRCQGNLRHLPGRQIASN